MAFINQAVTVLQTLVIALGAGLAVWGVVNLMEGYGNDNPGAKVAGTYWTFIGGYVDGVQMTADQTQEVMSQLHDVYQFIFVDESKVVLAEDEEQTEGTYSLSEDGGTMKIDRKSTRLNSSHTRPSRMPSSA